MRGGAGLGPAGRGAEERDVCVCPSELHVALMLGLVNHVRR